MISLLTAFAPLILNLGLGLIGFFITNAANKAQAQQQFLNLFQAHLNDAAKSVNLNINYAQQLADFNKPPMPPSGPSAA